MKDEKLEVLIDYINQNETIYIKGKRTKQTRNNVDKRTYIIFILIVRHQLSYFEISSIFGTHRSISYNILGKISYLLNDRIFNNNTKEVQELFPYTEEDIIRVHSILRNKKILAPKKVTFNKLSSENIFGLREEDIKKLRNSPTAIKTIKNIISML